MELNKVDRETAIGFLNAWMDEIDYEGERIPEVVSEDDTRQEKIGEEMLIKSVCSGHIIFDENHQLTIQLKRPIMSLDNNVVLDKLTFKNRLTTFEYNKSMNGVKANDADGRMLATIAAFSNTASGKISKLSTKEIRILQIIAGYLL